MLVWLTLPFYDFCGFRSVAVNSVYKLQFFYIYRVNICGAHDDDDVCTVIVIRSTIAIVASRHYRIGKPCVNRQLMPALQEHYIF